MNITIMGSGYVGLVSGTCFLKDVKALKKIAEEHAYGAELISAVLVSRRGRKKIFSLVLAATLKASRPVRLIPLLLTNSRS